jgi:hypothetical protein
MYSLYNYFLNRKWSGPFWSFAFRTGLRLRDLYHTARDAAGYLVNAAARANAAPETTTLRRILIVRVDRVGDIVLSTPMLHALRNAYPEARIDYLVQTRYAPLLKAYAGWSELITWDDVDDADEKARLIERIRAAGYEAAVIGRSMPAGYRQGVGAHVDLRFSR